MNIGLKRLAVVLLLVVGKAAWGQADPMEQGLEAKLKAEPFLILRGMYAGNHLDFDAQGKLIQAAETIPFSLSAVLVEQVHVTETQTQIEGVRAGLEIQPDPDTKAPEKVTAVPWKKNRREKITITIARDPSHPELTEATLERVLSFGLDDGLLGTIPDYLQPWLQHQLHPEKPQPLDSVSEGAEPLRMADGKLNPNITPPRLVSRPSSPEFSSQARSWLFQGTCVVALIVDASGDPQAPRIVQALGMGLDEEAIKALKTYRFKAAMKDRRAIPVRVKIEVDFRTYQSQNFGIAVR